MYMFCMTLLFSLKKQDTTICTYIQILSLNTVISCLFKFEEVFYFSFFLFFIVVQLQLSAIILLTTSCCPLAPYSQNKCITIFVKSTFRVYVANLSQIPEKTLLHSIVALNSLISQGIYLFCLFSVADIPSGDFCLLTLI